MATDLKVFSESLYNNPTLSDIKIKQTYKGKSIEYSAHKAVLSLYSDFFNKAFTGGFAEAVDPEMEVHDDNPLHFRLALKFIYSQGSGKDVSQMLFVDEDDELPAEPDLKEPLTAEVYRAVGLYIIADKYDITELFKPTVRRVKTKWVADLPETQNMAIVRKVVPFYFKDCPKPGTPMGKAIVRRVPMDLLGSESQKTIDELMVSNPVFGADIGLMLSRRGLLSYKIHHCRGCAFPIGVENGDPASLDLLCPFCQRKYQDSDISSGESGTEE